MRIKKLLIGITLGVAVGLWFGVNIAKDRPFYSNPFAEDSITDRLKESTGDMLEKSGKALKDSLDK